MKKDWISNAVCSLKYVVMAALFMLSCLGCENDFERAPLPMESNILATEDHWVNPEGTSLIALGGDVYIDFSPGAVTVPTLITIASVALDDHPMEEYNSLDYGILITNSSQDLVFENSVNIRLNYAIGAFQRSAKVNEENLTIYKMESIGSLSERLVSIGQCCVDCSCKTVQGCIGECGLYVIGELYVVIEVR